MKMQREEIGLWGWLCRGWFAGFVVAYLWLLFSLWQPIDPAQFSGDLAEGKTEGAEIRPGERSRLLGVPIASHRAKTRPARRSGVIL